MLAIWRCLPYLQTVEVVFFQFARSNEVFSACHHLTRLRKKIKIPKVHVETEIFQQFLTKRLKCKNQEFLYTLFLWILSRTLLFGNHFFGFFFNFFMLKLVHP